MNFGGAAGISVLRRGRFFLGFFKGRVLRKRVLSEKGILRIGSRVLQGSILRFLCGRIRRNLRVWVGFFWIGKLEKS